MEPASPSAFSGCARRAARVSFRSDMCGRFTLVVPSAEDLADALGVDTSTPSFEAVRAAYRPRYNVAPTDPHWVMRMKHGARELMGASFGLVPRWAKSTADRAKAINARGETIAAMPKFRDSFARRRCVVAADGFLEWRTVEGAKRPLWFTPRAGGILPMAGIYDKWVAPDGATLRSFSIVTIAANDFMRGVHDRMPVLLAKEDIDAWISGPYSSEDGTAPPVTDEVRALLRPAPDDFLVMTPVSSRVNSVRNDDPACLLAGEEEPPAAKKPRIRKAPKSVEQRDDMPLFPSAVSVEGRGTRK